MTIEHSKIISSILDMEGEDSSFVFSYKNNGDTQVIVNNPEESFRLLLNSIRAYDPVLYTELIGKMIISGHL